MKEGLHKIIGITMAFLLLLSTTSWKVEKHYCMGRLIDVAMFSDVDSCGMDMSISSEDVSDVEYSCCDDEIVVFDGQDDLQFSLKVVDLEKISFYMPFVFSYSTVNTIQNIEEVLVEQYPPPQLVKDIQVLDQVFLI